MSERNIGLYIAIAAVAAVAFFALSYTDISSAEPDGPAEGFTGDSVFDIHDDVPPAEKDEPCSEPVRAAESECMGHSVAADVGRCPDIPVIGHGSDTSTYDRQVPCCRTDAAHMQTAMAVPGYGDIYDAVKEVLGEGTVIALTAEDGSVSETVEISQIDTSSVDEEFLISLADALEGSSPDLSEMIRSLLELRAGMMSTAALWVCSGEGLPSDRKSEPSDTEDETEGNEPAVIDDGDDADDNIPMDVLPSAPYASCGTECVAIASVYAAECCHGAADGPVL